MLIILIITGAALAWYFLGKFWSVNSGCSQTRAFNYCSQLLDQSIKEGWDALVLQALQHYFTSQFVLCFSSLTDYKVWVLESRVQQQYIICLSILNRNFSADLSSHTSPAFKREAKGVQNMVSCICHLEVTLRRC